MLSTSIEYSMPKKTRQEKIISAYRKRIKELQQSPTSFSHTIQTPPPQVKKAEINKKAIDTSGDTALRKFFFQDLIKSVFFIAFIIGLEIVLYFVSMKRL